MKRRQGTVPCWIENKINKTSVKSFKYFGLGKVYSASEGNGKLVQTFSYDKQDWLETIKSGEGVFNAGSFEFKRENNGIKKTVDYMINGIGAKTDSFTYDEHNRLVTADKKEGALSLVSEVFDLDKLDNFNFKTFNNQTSNYGLKESVRIDKINEDDNLKFEYDTRGNTVKDDKFNYSWDDFDRIKTITNKNLDIEPYANLESYESVSFASGSENEVTFTFDNQAQFTVDTLEIEGVIENDLIVEYKAQATDPDWLTIPATKVFKTALGPTVVSFGDINVGVVRVREQEEGNGFELDTNSVFQFKNYIFPANVWKNIEYLYDSSGRRVQKIVEGSKGYWFLFADYQMLEERTFTRGTTGSELRRQVVYGTAINEPVYIFDAVANKNYYLLKNDQNTVLAIYDSTLPPGTLPDEQYEYSSYGITTIQDSLGVVKNQVKSDFSNPFGYQGMWRDEHTGLYHTHYRLYDPQHVRWLTPDPAGYRDGQNLYRFYAGPNGVDPLGLSEIGIHEEISLIAFSKAYGKFSWAEFMAPNSKKRPTVEYVKEGLTEGVASIDWPEGFLTFLWVFKNPERYKNTKKGDVGYETYQTHFGINQHLHFMAPDNITPVKFKEKVIDDILIFRTDAINALKRYKEGAKFSNDMSMMSGSDLEDLKKAFVYIGKILHVIQDSFAQGHALRNDKNEIYMIQNYDLQYHGGLIEQAPGIGSSLHAQMDKIIPKMSIEMSSILFSKLDNEVEFKKWLNDDVFKFAEGVKVEVPVLYTKELERIRDKAARLIQGSLKGYSDHNSIDPFGGKYDMWTR